MSMICGSLLLGDLFSLAYNDPQFLDLDTNVFPCVCLRISMLMELLPNQQPNMLSCVGHPPRHVSQKIRVCDRRCFVL